MLRHAAVREEMIVSMRLLLLVIGSLGFLPYACLADCGSSLTESQVVSLKFDLQNQMNNLKQHVQALLHGQINSLEQRTDDAARASAHASENMYLRIDDAFDHAVFVSHRLDGVIELARLKAVMFDPRDRMRIERSLAMFAAAAESEARDTISIIGTVTIGASRPNLAADVTKLLDSLKKVANALSNCNR